MHQNGQGLVPCACRAVVQVVRWLGICVKRLIQEILSKRILADGGLTDRTNGQFRIDSTAWGILAFQTLGESAYRLEPSRARLRSEQGGDGRVWVSREHPDSYWATPLAILAWQSCPASQAAQSRAVKFLLETTGVHYPRKSGEPATHDPLLKGWPWVADTHSWIEPTALALIALKTTGHGQHGRVREAIRMMLDRQLPHGGWNYGNTLVFGRELHPMPESTGAALTGLTGEVDRETVSRSLDYLQGEVDRLCTPLSLGWALLGLAAWGVWPPNGTALVERCLANQTRYGEYDTSALCLLFLGALAGKSPAQHPLLTYLDSTPAILVQ